MQCSKDIGENISIPVVEMTKSVGDVFNKILKSGKRGQTFNF